MQATLLDHALKMLFYLPSSIMLSYFMARTIKAAHPKRFILALNLFQFTSYALFAILFIHYPWGRDLNSAIQMGSYILAPFIGGRESIPRRCLSIAFTLLAIAFSELISMIFFTFVGGAIDLNSIVYATQNVPLYFLFQTIVFISTLLEVFLFLKLWDRLVLKLYTKILWYYALFPVSQGVLFSICLMYISLTGLSAERYIILALVALFCVVVDTLLFRSMDQLTQKAIAEERAVWSESLLLQQESYYAQIIADTEDAVQIRHDIRNQLQTAYSLMAQGNTIAAQSQLDGIVSRLERRKIFCTHKVVNAVLTLKADRFASAHIPFTCNCDVPQDLPFDGVELCSLFSNVLDNAYQATLDCTGEVSLNSYIKQGYFILNCSNPLCSGPKRLPRKGHGVGLVILRDLVQRHEGELKVEETNNRFQITVWMHL